MTHVDPKDAIAHSRSEGNCHVALTHEPLDILATMSLVRSPKAGAIVLFAGTTRSTFLSQPVHSLTYTSYPARALATMSALTQSVVTKHSLLGIAMVHRLGTVPIGEESILIAVAAPHRAEAWRGAQEALEECKARVEVWKREEFGAVPGEDGVWRANRDGVLGGGPGGGGVGEEEEGEGGRERRADDGVLGGASGDIVRPGPVVERGHEPVVHPDH